MRSISGAIAILLLLSGCALTERFGLFNTSGTAESSDTAENSETAIARTVEDGREIASEVRNLRLDYTQSGAIIRAEGMVPDVGFHSAILRPVNFGTADEAGVVRFEFRASPPSFTSSSSGDNSHVMTAATFLPNSRLRGVNAIVIMADRNESLVRIR